ncbi:hypothetical protein ACFSTE_16445 [Aquimarina hainanensis]|uniref:Lysine 2,3-aminomutase n=1 Tax=Aquimarina hainanensis TaxID=1578017 RepID=A0ABW5NBF8_9FLAO
MKFKSYTSKTFKKTTYYSNLPVEERKVFDVLTRVFHFKINNYVIDTLINWQKVPNDPIYKLVFPRKEMLHINDYLKLIEIQESGSETELLIFINHVKNKMFPKINYNENCVPIHNGSLLKGAYRSFKTTLALYPNPMVKTCHSYCSYCFRWVTFNDYEMQNASSYDFPLAPVSYLKEHKEITDVVFTGADPLIIKADTLKKYIDPILDIESVKVINITSKSLAWWPYRFITDVDSYELLNLFEYIISKGKHLNILAHFTHSQELEGEIIKEATQRIKRTGAIIRCQGPLVRDINDSTGAWVNLWTKQIELGLIPFYMLMEADHNKESCFKIPLDKALHIFEEAQKQTSSMSRTARGPVFVNDVHKILIDGTIDINDQKYFVLKSLQAPPYTDGEGSIKLLQYDKDTKGPENLFELFEEKQIDTISL